MIIWSDKQEHDDDQLTTDANQLDWLYLYLYHTSTKPGIINYISKTLARRTAHRASVFQRTVKSPGRKNRARLE